MVSYFKYNKFIYQNAKAADNTYCVMPQADTLPLLLLILFLSYSITKIQLFFNTNVTFILLAFVHRFAPLAGIYNASFGKGNFFTQQLVAHLYLVFNIQHCAKLYLKAVHIHSTYCVFA